MTRRHQDDIGCLPLSFHAMIPERRSGHALRSPSRKAVQFLRGDGPLVTKRRRNLLHDPVLPALEQLKTRRLDPDDGCRTALPGDRGEHPDQDPIHHRGVAARQLQTAPGPGDDGQLRMLMDPCRRNTAHYTVRHPRSGHARQDAGGSSRRQARVYVGAAQKRRRFECHGGLQAHPDARAEIIDGERSRGPARYGRCRRSARRDRNGGHDGAPGRPNTSSLSGDCPARPGQHTGRRPTRADAASHQRIRCRCREERR